MHRLSSQLNEYTAEVLRWKWSIRQYITCTLNVTYFAKTKVPCKTNATKGKTNKISKNVEKINAILVDKKSNDA